MDEFQIRVSYALSGAPVVVVTHLPTGLVRVSAFERDTEVAIRRCIESIRKRLGELDAATRTESPRGCSA